MAIIFNWDARKGDYVSGQSITGTTSGSPTFVRTKKGNAIKLSSGKSVSFTIPSSSITNLISLVNGKGTLRISCGANNTDIAITRWTNTNSTVSYTGITTLTFTATAGYVYLLGIYVYNTITTKEVNDINEKYLRSFPVDKSKYGFEYPKPTSLNESGLVAAYSFDKSTIQGNTLIDISNNGKNGIIYGAVFSGRGLKFTTNDKVTLGAIGNVKSIAFRISPTTTTEKILEGAANSKLVHISTGTLTANDFATKYVNGVAGSTMVAKQYQTVVLTSASDVNLTAASLALNNTTYGNFSISDLRFYSYALSASQALVYHNSFKKPVLLEDFSSYPVGKVIRGRKW